MAFSATDYNVRYHWKYSMEVHGIPGAPLFAANSVIIDGAEDFGFEDWIDFFEKYTDWSYENHLYYPILKGSPEVNVV